MADNTKNTVTKTQEEKTEIVQPVEVEWGDTTFTLDFTRDTAAQLQANGFDMDKIATEMLIQPLLMFTFAFKAHHPNAKRKVIQEIWETFDGDDKSDITKALIELYSQTITSTWNGKGEGEGKKAKWRVRG